LQRRAVRRRRPRGRLEARVAACAAVARRALQRRGGPVREDQRGRPERGEGRGAGEAGGRAGAGRRAAPQRQGNDGRGEESAPRQHLDSRRRGGAGGTAVTLTGRKIGDMKALFSKGDGKGLSRGVSALRRDGADKRRLPGGTAPG